MINNIAELKTVIADLPDEMLVKAYKGGGGDLYPVDFWLITDDTLTEEEIREGYPEGVTPTLVLDVD